MVDMEERRTEARMLCADIVEVTWKERSGRNRRTTGVLEDISTSGACLQLEAALPVGAEIEWRSPKREFKGVVRYCVYRDIGYFVGVELDSASKWSKKTYRPQHLLDLKKLIG